MATEDSVSTPTDDDNNDNSTNSINTMDNVNDNDDVNEMLGKDNLINSVYNEGEGERRGEDDDDDDDDDDDGDDDDDEEEEDGAEDRDREGMLESQDNCNNVVEHTEVNYEDGDCGITDPTIHDEEDYSIQQQEQQHQHPYNYKDCKAGDFLEAYVFPSLLPSIEALLQKVKRIHEESILNDSLSSQQDDVTNLPQTAPLPNSGNSTVSFMKEDEHDIQGTETIDHVDSTVPRIEEMITRDGSRISSIPSSNAEISTGRNSVESIHGSSRRESIIPDPEIVLSFNPLLWLARHIFLNNPLYPDRTESDIPAIALELAKDSSHQSFDSFGESSSSRVLNIAATKIQNCFRKYLRRESSATIETDLPASKFEIEDPISTDLTGELMVMR